MILIVCAININSTFYHCDLLCTQLRVYIWLYLTVIVLNKDSFIHSIRDGVPQKEKERERMQCFMKKKDKSMLYVENVETTGIWCCHLSWRTPLNCSLCMFIGMKHISPTFRYIISFETDNIYKNPPPNVISPNLLLFCPFWGSTHYFADCWSVHRSPASNVSPADAGWVALAGCPPPKKNPGYAGAWHATYNETSNNLILIYSQCLFEYYMLNLTYTYTYLYEYFVRKI